MCRPRSIRPIHADGAQSCRIPCIDLGKIHKALARVILGRIQPDFYNKLWSGDIDGARRCGAKDCKLLEAWYTPELIGRHGAAPAVMKTGLMLRGVPMRNHVRAPLMDVRPEDIPAIRRTLEDLGVSIDQH